MADNRRWARGTARHPRQSPKWRRFPADHQNPFATLVSRIEFGPQFFASAGLVVVLGHQKCDAVEKAIEVIRSGGRAPGTSTLRPAYYAAKPQPGDLVDNMVRAQIRLTVQLLKADPLLGNQLSVAGRCAMASGVVDIIA